MQLGVVTETCLQEGDLAEDDEVFFNRLPGIWKRDQIRFMFDDVMAADELRECRGRLWQWRLRLTLCFSWF